jgi:hypothetical protein
VVSPVASPAPPPSRGGGDVVCLAA